MSNSQFPPRKSVRPSFGVADVLQVTQVSASVQAKSSQVERVRKVAARCTVSVTVEARTWYVGDLTEKAAFTLGTRNESVALVERWIESMNSLLPSILAMRLSGYGPMRAAYACELALDVAAQSAAVAAQEGAKAERSASVENEFMDVGRLRRKVARVVRTLIGKRPQELARVRQASSHQNSRGAKVQTLESLTSELERLLREVPAEVAHDAGATAELLARAKRASANATDTWHAHGETRVTVASAYDALHVATGRLAHELNTLLAAADDTRKDDPRVPSTAKKRAHRAKAAKPAATPTPAAPTPPPNDAPAPTEAPSEATKGRPSDS